MGSNHNIALNNAMKVRDDEYYTLYDDIAEELPKYKQQLCGKRIICPCDWDESYHEEIVFRSETATDSTELFESGTIKEIDIAETQKRIEKDFSLIKCNFVKFLVSHADDYGIVSISVSGYNPKTNEGVRFQDVDYSKFDLVITNPPFSQFGEFIEILMKNHKKFLVIGPLLAIKYKAVFPYIQKNELWLGYAKQLIGFGRPDGKILLSKNLEGSVPRACKWYTNLDVFYRHDKMILTEIYDPIKYPKYCNYDAIFVNRTIKIPMDYDGEMGVPISFLQKYNPEQFEIVNSSAELAKPIYINGKKKSGCFYLIENDEYKRLFDSLVIRNKHPQKIDEI